MTRRPLFRAEYDAREPRKPAPVESSDGEASLQPPASRLGPRRRCDTRWGLLMSAYASRCAASLKGLAVSGPALKLIDQVVGFIRAKHAADCSGRDQSSVGELHLNALHKFPSLI